MVQKFFCKKLDSKVQKKWKKKIYFLFGGILFIFFLQFIGVPYTIWPLRIFAVCFIFALIFLFLFNFFAPKMYLSFENDILVFSNKYGTVKKIDLQNIEVMLRFQLDLSIFSPDEMRVRFKTQQEKIRFIEELAKFQIIPKPFDFSYVFKKT